MTHTSCISQPTKVSSFKSASRCIPKLLSLHQTFESFVAFLSRWLHIFRTACTTRCIPTRVVVFTTKFDGCGQCFHVIVLSLCMRIFSISCCVRRLRTWGFFRENRFREQSFGVHFLFDVFPTIGICHQCASTAFWWRAHEINVTPGSRRQHFAWRIGSVCGWNAVASSGYVCGSGKAG